MEALEYALDHDIWFSTYTLGAEIWAPLRGSERFASIESRNEAFRQEAQREARPERLVVPPEGYDKTQTYPLFIALHGGGENMAHFQEVWTSSKMTTEFVTAYLQSSQVTGMDEYNWTEDLEISTREIAQAYREIIDEYPVAEDRVIVGGFSSGGVATLEVALTDAIPLTGFIALCPAKPESFAEESVARAKARGLRGTLLTSEMDPRLPEQKEMAAILEKAGLPHQFVVTPNVGHWIPEDLGAQIDSAIGHILE
jgi:predicted esterase